MTALRRAWELPQRLHDARERSRQAARLAADVEALHAEVAALAARVQERELHAHHVETQLHETEQQRQLQAGHAEHLAGQLHAAKDRLTRFTDAGLRVDQTADPEAFARWLTWCPPGHFYSPIPNLHELDQHAATLWPEVEPAELPGIDLRADEQLATFTQVAKLAREIDVPETPTEPWRFSLDNVAFGIGDALTLFGMLRHIRPRRLIEIGSGHSSAMTLDTVEHYLHWNTELTFIEPYPQLLESLLRPGDRDRVSIIASGLRETPLDTFATLQSGDVLFIDSTHVVKTGNDVTWLYAEVLPRLNEGVWVHIHDIFYPFEYLEHWVREGRAWGEAYLLRAFLAFNSQFEIVLFNDWLAKVHEDLLAAELPAMLDNTGGSLWLRRTGHG